MMYIIPFCFNFIEWTRDHLINPFIEAVTNIAVEALKIFINTILEAIYTAFVGFLFALYVGALKILDIFQDIFGYFSGVDKIFYTIDGVKKTGYATDVLVNMPAISDAFWAVWLLSVLLCGIFLIAAVIKSISHLDDSGRTINDVLKSSAKTFVMFLVIQVVMFGTISLSNIVIDSTSKAMNAAVGSEEEIRFSNAIFAVTAVNAIPTGNAEKDIKSLLSDFVGGKSFTAEEFEKNWETCKEFYTGKKKYYDVTDYTKKDSALPLILSKIDYLSGFLCIIFLFKYLAGAALSFVQRIIMVVLCFITAPFFIALTPLDDGERFSKWKDLFIGNCLSSIGTILSVRIYFLVLPMFLADGFIYSGAGVLSYIIRLLSVILLSLAFEKVGDIFNRILSDANINGPSGAFSMVVGVVQEAKGFSNSIKNTKKAFKKGKK